MDIGMALFDDSLSRYTLDINDSTVTPDVLRFRGREALSEPFRWKIEFTTTQANIAPEQVLMKYASFRMRSGKMVHGIITGLEWLSTSADQSHYRVTLASRLALLSRSKGSAVYQNQSVPEVVEQVLRAHGLEGPDFEFRLERSYPSRELITQWRETDLEFVSRLLAEVGIDLPYIAYALHDSAHPDHMTRDNHTRNILRTPANSELRMEDKRGEEHIKLATEADKTQLKIVFPNLLIIKRKSAEVQSSDSTNEYDNFFVLRGAVNASKNFTYNTKVTGKTFPVVDAVETSIEANSSTLGKNITKEELDVYVIWNKK